MQIYDNPEELGIKNYWWDESEYFWLEITNRDKSLEISQRRGFIGDNIWIPQFQTNGNRNAYYSLVAMVKPGDVVFHYSKTKQGIVGYSKVQTYAYEDRDVWGPLGSYASESKPFLREIFKADLTDFTEYNEPLTIIQMRENQSLIQDTLSSLQEEFGTLYAPFIVKNNQLEPPQAYFAKFPKDIVKLLGLFEDNFSESSSKLTIKSSENKKSKKKRNVDSKRKKIVELYAMDLAIKYYESLGWKVNDTSDGTYDLTCEMNEKILYVEVKGTQGEFNKVNLTKNEVIGHRKNNNQNSLFIVSEIVIKEDKGTGGVCFVRFNWFPEDKDLEPTQYNYFLNDKDFKFFNSTVL
tara:strand:+ start:1392 stop:2444 length:1053 start_codon:yes stop_codon:yes gene_type:complete